ncbi:DUF2515 domain-containing protein [Bacillus dakarensis]|uniref:DUF2515 domain-containing protein n=1 Tax=Robertmurraya dakarensis TaxID=1926278 RepID=UPI0009821B52|nr:DUF2515 domain-containing protein [Bacillus dakarensis]
MWFLPKIKNRLPQHLQRIKKELIKKKTALPSKETLPRKDRLLLQEITKLTEEYNLNNVTRTKAYLEFYQRCPEIHWAFLGHMVSRNGGWNMTDLKGSLLSRLLTKKQQDSFFSFLERGNWLIFQDAYPQFLVYEESLKRGINSFYLLPYLHVSAFMESVWNYFWKDKDKYTLTVALVINEQSYLESRILADPTFKKEIFNSLEFQLQDVLSMNHILLPFENSGRIQLIGQTLHHFESLHERILLGKRLYEILFSDGPRLRKIEKWAKSTPHTGSRKDYWPHLFHSVDEGIPGTFLKPRLISCELAPGSPRFYSPALQSVWKDVKHLPAEKGDWYKNWQVIYYLMNYPLKVDGEIENEYCKTIEKIEIAGNTKKVIFD